jgi:Fe-S cluster assembly protein SufB/Fe-S cluster assembly protein SufD
MGSFTTLNGELVRRLALERGEPTWLAEYRGRAWNLFKELPLETSPLFTKYVEVSEQDLDASQVAEAEPQVDTHLISSLTRASGGAVALYVDGRLIESSRGLGKAEGVELQDVVQLARVDEAKAREVYEAPSLRAGEDKALALGAALHTGGAYISVAPGVRLDEPIRIVHIHAQARAAFTWDLVRLGEGSSATVSWEAYSAPEAPPGSILGHTMQVQLGADSEANIIALQDFSPKSVVLLNRESVASRDSRVRWMVGHFGGGKTRARLWCHMRGAGASSEAFEVSFVGGERRLDTLTLMHHDSQHSRSISLSRSAVRERARAVLKGLIRIEKHAKYSDAYLAENAMVLDRGARVDPIPSLEIETNEVRATHAGSVAQLDEEQLFYLMTRGFRVEEARMILVEAFYEPLIGQIPLQEARFKIRQLLKERWAEMGVQSPIEEEEEGGEARPITVYDMFQSHYKYRPMR